MKKSRAGYLSLILLSPLFGSCKDPSSAPQTPANTITIIGPRQGLATYPYTISAEINYKPMDVPTYVWKFSDTTIETSILKLTRSFPSVGTYRYTVEAYSGSVHVCDTKDSFVVRGTAISILPDSLTGDIYTPYIFTVQISPDLHAPRYTLVWNIDTFSTTRSGSSRDTLSYMFTKPGLYQVRATYRDSTGNERASASIPVTIRPPVNFYIEAPDSAVLLESVPLRLRLAGPTTATSVKWVFGDGKDTVSSLSDITHAFFATGAFMVEATLMNGTRVMNIARHLIRVAPYIGAQDLQEIKSFDSVRVEFIGAHQYSGDFSFTCSPPGSNMLVAVKGVTWSGDTCTFRSFTGYNNKSDGGWGRTNEDYASTDNGLTLTFSQGFQEVLASHSWAIRRSGSTHWNDATHSATESRFCDFDVTCRNITLMSVAQDSIAFAIFGPAIASVIDAKWGGSYDHQANGGGYGSSESGYTGTNWKGSPAPMYKVTFYR